MRPLLLGIIGSVGMTVAVGATPVAAVAQRLATNAPVLPLSGAVQADTSRCSYAVCALRIEPGFWGPKLVRGDAGEAVVGLAIPRDAEIQRLFAGQDSARVYAARFVRAERTNLALSMLGAIAFGIGVTQDDPDEGLVAGGLGLLIFSLPFQQAAQRDLSRAVWWYNSTLAPRGDSEPE